MRRVIPFLALACAGCWVPMYEEERPARARIDYGDPLTRVEVEKLLKAGVSDSVIVEKAKKSGAAKLSADDIVTLKQAGASDELIKQLIASERRVSVVHVPTTTYVYHDYWWGPSVTMGWSYDSPWHHHHHRSGRWGVGVRVGW